MTTNKVAVVALDRRYKKLEDGLKKKAGEILLFLKQSGAKIEVYLVASPKMKQLNRQYQGKDKATNVLSFGAPQNFPKANSNFLGEVYLCPPYIRRHGENIQALLAHGILHLLGFNHTRLSDRIIMEETEKKLLTWLNH